MRQVTVPNSAHVTRDLVVGGPDGLGQAFVAFLGDVTAVVDPERVQVQLETMVSPLLLPAAQHATLGVHQQAVEIKDNR